MTKCTGCNGCGYWTLPRWPDARYVCQSCFGSGNEERFVEYAGIGSRETPNTVIAQMKMIGAVLGARGYVLRSGAGKVPIDPKKRKPDTHSADLAFEEGAKSVNGKTFIRTSTTSQSAIYHAALFHPNWSACSEAARALHGRNSQVMLRDTLNRLPHFVVCYTTGGAVIGGTGQALRIATAYNVPVYNYGNPAAGDFWQWLAGIGL